MLFRSRIARDSLKADMLKEGARMKSSDTKDMMNKGVDIIKQLSSQHNQQEIASMGHEHQAREGVANRLHQMLQAQNKPEKPTRGE